MNGVIKRLVRDRGFGFIREENGQKEWFFHRSELDANNPYYTLKEGDRVTFEEGDDAKGPRAMAVRLA